MSNNSQPLVTIGIPTYNRADAYLPQALTSALQQTYPNLEIIVSDNCSTDHTESVVLSLSDSRIRYVKQSENIGAVNNFNFCLKEATGDYFLLLHDDDLIDEDFVDVCMKAANYSTDFGIIRTGTRIFDARSNVLREFPNLAAGTSTEDFFRGWFSDRTVWYLCSTVFHTHKLREVGGFETNYPYWPEGIPEVRLGAQYPRVDVKDVKASFREHDEELTAAVKMTDWCDSALALLDCMCEHADNKAVIRAEGWRHFSGMCYGLAHRTTSPVKLLLGYIIVFKTFKYPPPIFYRFFYRNPTYRRMLNKIALKKIAL